ncbi:FtsX-like permease family protein [bacterium 210820-DFI.6.37]|nr:FtsX-like permease family protein [bacterium 210820-DFI.6.37]
MKINRRYTRNIRENLSFYVASTILTMVSIFMFFVMNIAGNGISDFGKEFFKEHNVEDASFSTYLPISDKDMKELEKNFDLELEAQHYINIKEDGYTVRVFSRNGKINTAEITAGSDISADNEILISEGFAVNQNLRVGDSFTIDKREYKICGFFQRPDYLYMLEELDDNYKNDTSFLLAYMSDKEFDRLNAGNCRYMVVFHKDNQQEFRSRIYDDYMTSEYVSADDNLRISFVEEQARLFLICSWIILVVVPFVTIALISIIIRRKVKDEQKMIGTLSAMGYRKGALIRHYAIMGVLPGLLGGILSVAVIAVSAQPYGEMGLADYEPLHIDFHMSASGAVAAILVPTLLYAISAALSARRLLREDTVRLLNGMAAGGGKTKKLWADKEKKVRKKFAFRSLIASPGRSFVIFLGIFLGAFIIMFAFMTIDAIKGLPDAYKSQVGDFNKQYVLNTFLSEERNDGETLITAVYETDGTTFSLIGADEDVSLLNIETADGRADLEDGWYISNLLAYICGVQKGDTITFVNRMTLEEYDVTVDGIIETDMQKYLVSSKEKVSEVLGIDDDLYNSVLSEGSLDIDNSMVTSEIDSNSIEDQMRTMMNEMGAIIYALIVIGGIICIAAIYVSVNMMVSENRLNISMLKVLGYRGREINRMVLSANHVLLPVGIAAGILLSYISIDFYFSAFAETEGMIIPIVLKPESIALTVVMVCACYFVSLAFIGRKTAHVDMVESLKDNRQ